jgi:hypothetical protein
MQTRSGVTGRDDSVEFRGTSEKELMAADKRR